MAYGYLTRYCDVPCWPDDMTMQTLHQTLFQIALLLFAVELLLLWKIKILHDPAAGSFEGTDDQLHQFLEMIAEPDSNQVAMFVVFYLLALWLAWQVHWILLAVMFVQLLSIASEAWVVFQLWKGGRSNPLSQ